MFGVRKAYRELVKPVREMQQENDQLKAENARLRSELESVGVAAYLYGRGDLLAENAKLRELCRRYGEYVSQDRCEGCVYKTRCNNGSMGECWQRGEIRDLARELGMEVTDG